MNVVIFIITLLIFFGLCYIPEVIVKIDSIKTEAYKEFAERLKKTFPKDDFLRSTKRISEDIDNLLKEMVGEDNAKEKE